MDPITRRRFIRDAATGLFLPLGMGKIAKAGVAILGGGGFQTKSFSSVTGHLDSATGFYTDGSLDLRPYVGRFATFTASAGNTIKFKIGGQSASGETYGSNLSILSSLNFQSGWTAAGASIASANTYTTTSAGGIYSYPTLAFGALFISSVSGSAPGTFLLCDTTLTTRYNTNLNGTTQYETCLNANSLFFYSTGNGTTTITSAYLKQVLTPSNGSTSGSYGAYFNGAAIVTGAPFDAASWTVTITAN